MFSLSDDDDPKETATAVPPSSASSAVEKNLQEEIAAETPLEDTLEKILKAPSIKGRKKMTQIISVFLEAHQTASSLGDVSTPCVLLYDMVQ
jgi:hypothetical protein